MMRDRVGRTIDYLRLSVTDLCNYRCIYCMGENGVCKKDHSEILSIEELAEIGKAAVACGVRKIRLTGGEPLVRRGILELCRRLKALEGLKELTLTTNGSMLPQMAADLKAAGVDRVNISLDTLDEDRFRRITRRGELREALDGFRAARDAGFSGIKINTVLMGGINDDEIPELTGLTKDLPISLRFIELMPLGVCSDWPRERFVSAGTVLRTVPELQLIHTDGVAEIYQVPGWAGTVGLIRPVSCSFCERCNRIRITADGKLKPCLHSSREIPLRGLAGEKLEQAIREAAASKPERHHLTETGRSGSSRDMNEIGG